MHIQYATPIQGQLLFSAVINHTLFFGKWQFTYVRTHESIFSCKNGIGYRYYIEIETAAAATCNAVGQLTPDLSSLYHLFNFQSCLSIICLSVCLSCLFVCLCVLSVCLYRTRMREFKGFLFRQIF